MTGQLLSKAQPEAGAKDSVWMDLGAFSEREKLRRVGIDERDVFECLTLHGSGT